jgi:hypothetical protein
MVRDDRALTTSEFVLFQSWDELGSVSRDAAVRKAQGELDRHDAERANLPSPVEAHFDEALREVEALAKKRPTKRRKGGG